MSSAQAIPGEDAERGASRRRASATPASSLIGVTLPPFRLLPAAAEHRLSHLPPTAQGHLGLQPQPCHRSGYPPPPHPGLPHCQPARAHLLPQGLGVRQAPPRRPSLWPVPAACEAGGPLALPGRSDPLSHLLFSLETKISWACPKLFQAAFRASRGAVVPAGRHQEGRRPRDWEEEPKGTGCLLIGELPAQGDAAGWREALPKRDGQTGSASCLRVTGGKRGAVSSPLGWGEAFGSPEAEMRKLRFREVRVQGCAAIQGWSRLENRSFWLLNLGWLIRLQRWPRAQRTWWFGISGHRSEEGSLILPFSF
ncbi:uncharacterized protein [Ovis canadensis]|uniref:uncharacterized protein n=1 Tax=Ovis canadensis TaxID=37174 RepID=UPI00375163BB